MNFEVQIYFEVEVQSSSYSSEGLLEEVLDLQLVVLAPACFRFQECEALMMFQSLLSFFAGNFPSQAFANELVKEFLESGLPRLAKGHFFGNLQGPMTSIAFCSTASAVSAHLVLMEETYAKILSSLRAPV